jgi:hypothetical protein
LQRKYPFVKHKIDSRRRISIAVSLIVYILQPFSFDLYQGNKIVASLGFGVITFICLYIFNYVIKKRIAKTLKKWTILSEILYILGLILTITILNYIYFSIVLMNFSFNVIILLYVIYYTFLIGLIPSVVLILIKYNRFLYGELNSLVDRKKEEDDLDITISNQLTREKDLKIKLSEFIFAEADRNNVKVYYLYGKELRCKSIRATITSAQEELNHSNLFRSHRSFIVNLSKIESAKGNSNGYLIKLKHYKKELPVLRKYVTDFKSFIY